MPYDAQIYKSTLNENRHTLHKQGQDPGNRDDIIKMEAMIDAFFSADGFFKRLDLHKNFFCCSKTKKSTTDSLYWIQMNEKEKVLNYLHPTNAEKMLNQRDSDAKKAKEEALEKLQN